MTFLDFTILALAVWRLSSLLVDENGPGGIFERFRHDVGVRQDELTGIWYGENHIAELLTCVWCTSIWISLIAAALYGIWHLTVVVLCTPFALSAAACIISDWVDEDDD